jgi:hypothetical protein
MWEFIKNHADIISASILSFVIGLYIADYAEKKNGIYVDMDFNGYKAVIGNNIPSVNRLNIENMDSSDSKALADKISTLSPGKPLSKELIVLRDTNKGPFVPEKIQLTVVIVDSPSIADTQALACKGGNVLGKELLLALLLNNEGQFVNPKNLVNINAVVKQEPNQCIDNNTGNTIWVKRADITKWLGTQDVNGNQQFPVIAVIKSSLY